MRGRWGVKPSWLKALCGGIEDIREYLWNRVFVSQHEEQSIFKRIVLLFIVCLLTVAMIVLNFKEFIREFVWKRKMKKKQAMFKECSVCKDGYDLSTITSDYLMVYYFCPQCVKTMPENALALILKFRDWGCKQIYKNGRNIGERDVLGIVLSVYYAIKNKASREPLFDAIHKYTWGNIGDTLTLVELLEELSILQENKLKSLKIT